MKSAKRYILAIVLGSVIGVLTLVGQKYLPMNLNFLANSGAVWLIPAFLLSYFERETEYSLSLSRSCACWAVFTVIIFSSLS